jgi:hypothetical protein
MKKVGLLVKSKGRARERRKKDYGVFYGNYQLAKGSNILTVQCTQNESMLSDLTRRQRRL